MMEDDGPCRGDGEKEKKSLAHLALPLPASDARFSNSGTLLAVFDPLVTVAVLCHRSTGLVAFKAVRDGGCGVCMRVRVHRQHRRSTVGFHAGGVGHVGCCMCSGVQMGWPIVIGDFEKIWGVFERVVGRWR